MSWVITCQKAYIHSYQVPFDQQLHAKPDVCKTEICEPWTKYTWQQIMESNVSFDMKNTNTHTHSMRWNMKSTNLWMSIRKKCVTKLFGSSCLRACVCVSVRSGIYEQIHFCRMTWLKIIVISPAGIVLSTETATECQSSRWHMTCKVFVSAQWSYRGPISPTSANGNFFFLSNLMYILARIELNALNASKWLFSLISLPWDKESYLA